ncbi:hydroxyphenylpyruvate reductase isoform X1 [Sorghum bicolor]|uniref:hydroxyphenylpyruvate reductase isoform X1 n=1 Tax=Sorghum bicolor TaxID=4558 RepID=UPI000B4267FA|nr:hydroxyphenylpyruvate reductase isoform X1 [Sorghum bicolor]|eukprot:XP_021318080.1 hydroxyphenylpyruvate reductase isoform X1 [Sorghum bicolor]
MHCRPLVATPALNTRATPSLLPQQPSRWHPPRRARRSQGSCSCAARTPPSPRRCGRASASTTSTPRARRSRPSSRPPRRRRTPRAPRSCWPAAPSRSTPRSWTPSPPSAASSPRAPEWTTSTSPSARAAASSSPARARSSPSTSLTTPSVSSSACSAASRPPTATSALGSGRRKGTTRLPPSGKRVGIIGLGSIGSRIAKRLQAFGCAISYHSRAPKASVPYRYFPDVHALAADSDALIVACALNDATRRIVGRRVLDALGPEGVLVNIARGGNVDEQELVLALQDGRIAGAGLDVFQNEPHVPPELGDMDNVVLTAHEAVFTEESAADLRELMIGNLEAFFSGKPLLTPVLSRP